MIVKKSIEPILYQIVFTTLWAALSLFAQSSSNLSSQGKYFALESKIQSLIEKGNLPSLQTAMVYEDSIIWFKVFGSGADKSSMYMIGSIQKVFTATAILQLHEKGLIHIENDINSYLPFAVRHPKYPEIPITISMLLSHRSGLEMFKNQAEWDMRFLSYKKDSSAVIPKVAYLSQEEFIKTSLDPNGANYSEEVWHFKPGTNYIYSNSAQFILSCLIEKVSGQSYSSYMHENIFQPLEMHNTMFYKDDSTANFAVPYTRKNMINIKLPFWAGERDIICSTAEDMAKFIIAHINEGRYKNFQLLKPETIELMREKHSPGKNIFHLSSNCPFCGYGLGIIQYSNKLFGHGGSTIGFQSLWSFDSSKKRGYVILTNNNGLLYGRENFDSVWKTVSAIEKEVKAEIGFSEVNWRIYLIIVCLTVGILINILYFRRNVRINN